jgi:hypothetical protein
MKKLLPTTNLNESIRRIACGDTGAASVIALLNRDSPQNIMRYLHSLDDMGTYGKDVYKLWDSCGGNISAFAQKLSI